MLGGRAQDAPNTAHHTAIHRKKLLYWAIQRTSPVPRPLYCYTAIYSYTAQCSIQPYIAIQSTTLYTPLWRFFLLVLTSDGIFHS